MSRKMLCCGILQKEIEHITWGKEVEIHYLDPGLHVDLDKLDKTLTSALVSINAGNVPVIIGIQCHPELEKRIQEYGGRGIQAKNCIEMLLGEKLAELDASGRNFYLTTGWLENWRKIFIEGLKWDGIDARQNFGYYDRILLLDNGITPIDDEKIIEFFDYTQVPIEILSIDLEHLRVGVERLLEEEKP